MSLSAKCGKLKGHKASVCCLAVQSKSQILASGGEDGAICRFDLRTNELIARIQVAGREEAVPSIAWHPTDSNLLYHCSGTTVACLDTRKEDWQAGSPQSFNYNGDEINCLDLNATGTLLASADDLGQVAIVDLAAGSLVRKLKPGHRTVASSILFRSGGRGWEVVTGGLDCQMIKWSISSGEPLRRWKMEAGEDPQPSQVCNPPMVHGLATPALPNCRVAGLARVVAVAKGDGEVAVYDLEAGAKSGRRGGAAGPSSTPVFSARCHAAAVNCVSFPEGGEGKLLLSGGNDGKVKLQEWTRDLPAGSLFREGEGLDGGGGGGWCVEHGQKVNCVAAPGNLDRVFVAGVSKTVSVYSVR